MSDNVDIRCRDDAWRIKHNLITVLRDIQNGQKIRKMLDAYDGFLGGFDFVLSMLPVGEYLQDSEGNLTDVYDEILENITNWETEEFYDRCVNPSKYWELK